MSILAHLLVRLSNAGVVRQNEQALAGARQGFACFAAAASASRFHSSMSTTVTSPRRGGNEGEEGLPTVIEYARIKCDLSECCRRRQRPRAL